MVPKIADRRRAAFEMPGLQSPSKGTFGQVLYSQSDISESGRIRVSNDRNDQAMGSRDGKTNVDLFEPDNAFILDNRIEFWPFAQSNSEKLDKQRVVGRRLAPTLR